MSLIVAGSSSVLGWAVALGAGVWYWRTIVPQMFDDENKLLYPGVLVLASLAYLVILIGAWRRRQGHGDGLPAMIVAEVVVAGIAFATLGTMGMLLVPSLVLATLASALPARRAGLA